MIFNNNSDREWEKYGRDNPYYGVITDARYHRDNLTAELKNEFLNSGVDYISGVVSKIHHHIDPGFKIARALDFGCGVGRLLVPLAAISDEVTGVDVSDSMLAEASRNCEERGIRNVELVSSDDNLSRVTGSYNLVHSLIVFQHIPVARGEKIFARLLELLTPGGIGVVHFTYAKTYKLGKLATFVKYYLPFFGHILANLKAGRPLNTPQMQMNCYDMNTLLKMIQQQGAAVCLMEFTDHGGELGTILYFKKH